MGVAPGERVPLSIAYQRLQKMLDTAKTRHMPLAGARGRKADLLANGHWAQATELAERILREKPHDAMALTVLAEIENAHGHLDFGRVYLKEALQSLGEREPAQVLLGSAPASMFKQHKTTWANLNAQSVRHPHSFGMTAPSTSKHWLPDH